MKHSGPGIRPGNRCATYSVQKDKNYDNIETLKRENRELRKRIKQLESKIVNRNNGRRGYYD